MTFKVGRQKSIPQTSTRVWKKLSSTTSWSLHPRIQSVLNFKNQHTHTHSVFVKAFPARSPRIRHRSELTERDWENALQGLGNIATMIWFFIHPVCLRVDSFDRRVTGEKRKSVVFSVCSNKKKSGRFIEILWALLIKQSFPSRLLDMRWL